MHGRGRACWASRFSSNRDSTWSVEDSLRTAKNKIFHPSDARAGLVAHDKLTTAAILRGEGLPVPVERQFAASDLSGALAWARDAGWPVVVKPKSGFQARGVTVGVADAEGLAEALSRARSPLVLVQRQYEGRAYRILASPRRVLAAYVRDPAHVVGDGVSSVKELVEAKNGERAANPHLGRASRRVRLGTEALALLAEQSLGVDDVPSVGQRVELSRVDNTHAGADTYDVTDELHPGIVDLACRAVAVVPGLETSGIDVLLPAGHTVDPALQDTIILEHNLNHSLGGHRTPLVGQQRNVQRLMVIDAAERRGISLEPVPDVLDALVLPTPMRNLDDPLWTSVEGVTVVDASEHGRGMVRLTGRFDAVARAMGLLAKRSREVLAVRADLAGEPFIFPGPDGEELRLPTLTPCPWLPPLPRIVLPDTSPVAVRVMLEGRVTGVGLRKHVARAARRGGVTGWVRNTHRGTVEVLLTGGRDAVDGVVDRIRAGTRRSSIVSVTVRKVDTAPRKSFRIRKTTRRRTPIQRATRAIRWRLARLRRAVEPPQASSTVGG